MDPKIKKSFDKVKADYLKVTNEVLDVRTKLGKINKQIELTQDVQIQLKRLEKVNLDKFVINMEFYLLSMRFKQEWEEPENFCLLRK